MRADLHAGRRGAAILGGAGVIGLFWLAGRYPDITDAVYGNALGPLLASVLSTITGLVPLPLVELVIVLFVGRQLVGLGRGLLDFHRGARHATNGAAAGALRFGADLGIVVALFYLLWGFHYARPPLEQRQGWNGAGAEFPELARLAEEMVEAANFAYTEIHFSDDAGTPTGHERSTGELMADLETGWREAETVLGPPGVLTVGFGRPKASLAGPVLDRLGISGFYFPWTGEASYNGGVPPVSLPHAVAHEMAHQRGYAREDEAGFAGWVTAASSPQPFERYSAYVFAQRQLLGAVAPLDPDRVRELVERRLPGVQRDIDALRAYWERYEGAPSRASRSMNDAFLRSQGVPDGILSYGRAVELLVAYARSRGGWLLR